MLVFVHVVIDVEATPLNAMVLPLLELPKLDPVIVTGVSIGPDPGETDETSVSDT